MKTMFYAACLLLAATPALATDFISMDINLSDLSDPVATMMDPGTIKPGPDGHRLATFLAIREENVYRERFMELDCSGARWRQLSSIWHDESGKTTPGTPDDSWAAIKTGSVGAWEKEIVCSWPNTLQGADIIQAGTVQDLVERASFVLGEMADRKIKEGQKK